MRPYQGPTLIKARDATFSCRVYACYKVEQAEHQKYHIKQKRRAEFVDVIVAGANHLSHAFKNVARRNKTRNCLRKAW